MRRLIIISILLLVPVLAFGQSQSSDKKEVIVIRSEKSKAIAAGLEMVCPILGNGYAGNAKRGILPAVTTVGGYVVLIAAGGESGEIPKDKEKQFAIGLGFMVLGKVWGVVSAINTVEEYNKAISSDKSRLSLEPADKGRVGAKLALRFY